MKGYLVIQKEKLVAVKPTMGKWDRLKYGDDADGYNEYLDAYSKHLDSLPEFIPPEKYKAGDWIDESEVREVYQRRSQLKPLENDDWFECNKNVFNHSGSMSRRIILVEKGKDVASDNAPGIVPCDTSFDSCNTDGIGEEFMKWAEQYWRLREIVTIKDPDSFAGEVCDYDYMRGMFVKKIDGLIKERLSPPEVPQTLNIIK